MAVITKKTKIKDQSLIKLSPQYQKLHQLIDAVDIIPMNDWTSMHYLAYICRKYKEKFGIDYMLTYEAAPSKSYEYKLTSKMALMLGAKACEGEKVRIYIDWFFENYDGKKPFRSVNAITKPDAVLKYLEQKTKNTKPTIYTKLPQAYVDVIEKFSSIAYIKTYGDLLYFKKAAECDPEAYNGTFGRLFVLLVEAGFQMDILNNMQ